ncbi:MAG: hypothetical protein B9S32_08235 [Verrucomicrobia bacterium Tous-C9LFEB]|nr:MAG: hypothetical protein B9S32_08235 [Verrucomicrobia bacterium Tous-C9LFEB]
MKRFFRYLMLARRTLLEHKLRSFLTILGIIFGVAAVIAMTAIGEGGKQEALAQIQQMGINNIFLNDLRESRRSAAEKGRYAGNGLDRLDLEYLLKTIPALGNAAAVQEKELFVQTDSYKSKRRIRGVDASYFDILGLVAEDGRVISPLDLQESPRVCVLGRDAEQELFQRQVSLGAFVRINDQNFRVIGRLAERPGYNNDVIVPVTASVLFERIEPFEPPLSQMVVQVKETRFIPSTASMVERAMLRRHFDVKDFEMIVPEALFRQQEHTRNIFNSIMILITGISLLVGGIGIMNIMLASVLERTKEIGIRRGMGATKKDIQIQFLAEAIVLTSAGGVIGIALGLLMTLGISWFTGWPTFIPIYAVIGAFSFSVLTGVIFGYYPAKNAGELDPIEALRYE